MKIFPLPKWLSDMPDGQRKRQALNRFYLRLAILYATQGGRAYQLAELLNIHPKTFNSQLASKVLASQHARDGIVRLLGSAFVPLDFPTSMHLPDDFPTYL